MNSSTSFLKEYNTGSIDVPQDSLKNGSITVSGNATFSWSTGSGSITPILELGGQAQAAYVNLGSDISDFNTLHVSGDFTISAWVNPSDINDSLTIFGKYFTTGSNRSFQFLINSNTSGIAYIQYSGGGPATTVGSLFNTFTENFVQSGVWTHLAITRTGSIGSIFRNGSGVYTNTTLADGDTTLVNPALGAAIYIGAIQNSTTTPDAVFNGKLGEVRYYNRVLSEAEIGSIHDDKNVSQGLVGYWKLNEGTGSIAYDSSDGTFEHYTTESINGVVHSIGFDNDTNFETGSLWVLVSGTGEQLLVRTTGLTNFTTYPFRYGTNVNGATGSPWTKMNYVVNGPLLIIGSDIGEATTIKNISIKYL